MLAFLSLIMDKINFRGNNMISILPERNREIVEGLYKKYGLACAQNTEAVVAKSREDIP